MTLPDKIKAIEKLGYDVKLASIGKGHPVKLWVTEETTRMFNVGTPVTEIKKVMEKAKEEMRG